MVLSIVFCGQNKQKPTETPTLEVPPTVTPFLIPSPPASTPDELPGSSELQAIVQYANDLNPWLSQAGQILERDGAIFKETEDGNDAALCDGRLEQDNATMKGVLDQIKSLSPPSDASEIHTLLLESGQAWTEALDNVEQFCDTGNQLYKIPAILKYWEAAAKLQDAWNRFWALIVAKGLEDWVQR
ncbi:MAG: hypothetical protein A2Z14_17410 [Chloroflexi bacterium RBG_16_48_8]|nr:MAG: hypothetical protein A2Z14_17410 [Chloroflexi bacterium RBG_16_48_8]